MLPQELPNDLRVRILENKNTLRNSQNCMDTALRKNTFLPLPKYILALAL